jgi:hypothetical protein
VSVYAKKYDKKRKTVESISEKETIKRRGKDYDS